MPRYNDPSKSKSARAARSLLRTIRAAPLRKGDRLPSETELAQKLGVSRWTVRQATQQLVRDGVLESRPGYGHIVRALRSRPTIGLLFNHSLFARTLHNVPMPTTFAVLLFNALRVELARRRCRVRLYLPDVDAFDQRMNHARLHRDLEKGRFAGLITTHWPHRRGQYPAEVVRADDKLMAALKQHEIPMAGISSRDLPHITTTTDMRAGGYEGARYFLDQGHRRIGLMSAQDQPRSFLAGFREAMAEAGAPVHEPWLCVGRGSREEHGYHEFLRLWQSGERPDALVIDDDALGKGAMTAAVACGAATDQQLRIACHAVAGGSLFMPRPHVKLEIDPAAYARDLVDKVLRMIREPGYTPQRTWVRPQVIEPEHDPFASFIPPTSANAR